MDDGQWAQQWPQFIDSNYYPDYQLVFIGKNFLIIMNEESLCPYRQLFLPN